MTIASSSFVHLPVQRLSGVPRERRLGVEGVDVADASAHEERDDRSGARLEMRWPRPESTRERLITRLRLGCQQPFTVEQVRKGQTGNAATGLHEKVTTGPERPLVLVTCMTMVTHALTSGTGIRSG